MKNNLPFIRNEPERRSLTNSPSRCERILFSRFFQGKQEAARWKKRQDVDVAAAKLTSLDVSQVLGRESLTQVFSRPFRYCRLVSKGWLVTDWWRYSPAIVIALMFTTVTHTNTVVEANYQTRCTITDKFAPRCLDSISVWAPLEPCKHWPRRLGSSTSEKNQRQNLWRRLHEQILLEGQEGARREWRRIVYGMSTRLI